MVAVWDFDQHAARGDVSAVRVQFLGAPPDVAFDQGRPA